MDKDREELIKIVVKLLEECSEDMIMIVIAFIQGLI